MDNQESYQEDNRHEYTDEEISLKKIRKTYRKKLVIAVVITALLSSSFAAMGVMHMRNKYGAFMTDSVESKNMAAKLKAVDTVLDIQYLYEYDKEALEQSAIKGYVEGLDEPYTHYYTPDEFKVYTEELSDSYVGIGVVVTVNEDNQIEVIAPFDGSPAHEAGVLPGDILTAVEGEEFDGEKLQEAVKKIKSGEVGTFVTVTLKRDGGEPFDLTIERKNVANDSVSAQMLDNGIGYIYISEFDIDGGNGRNTYTEFKESVDRLNSEGMQKLIIDLRDNPGGALDVACDIADMIVPEGIITYMEYKDGSRQNVNSDANEMDIPTAVLINGNSASASEVLTGCLKDYGKTTVIGTRSYGKGIVQTVFPFGDGSGMSMTTAKYYSPNGVCIHGEGIEPDIVVEMPEEYKDYYASSIPKDEDVQLQKAIEILNN